MSLPLHLFLIVVSLLFLAYVLLMVRRDRFLLKYSLVWVVLGVLGVIAAFCPEGVSWLSDQLGFELPVNFLFLVTILFLMTASFVFVGALSRQAQQTQKIIQELSMLKAEIDESREGRENAE